MVASKQLGPTMGPDRPGQKGTREDETALGLLSCDIPVFGGPTLQFPLTYACVYQRATEVLSIKI